MELDALVLARLKKLPFYVYSPSSGGGREWADLIRAGLVEVTDVGDDQETVLLVSATDTGKAALSGESRE